MFTDRQDAGRQLAAKLRHLSSRHPVVLGLPRGGVVVAAEVAAALDAPLDVLVVAKIPAPHQPELAMGAVTDGTAPHAFINEDIVDALRVSRRGLDEATARRLELVRERQELYRAGRPAVEIAGSTAIIVDDGIATGATVHVGLDAVRSRRPERLVLAVPVAPPESMHSLGRLADEVVCLQSPAHFAAVGSFYLDFGQVDDAEVVRLLDAART